jgi:hypothetical protein
MSPRCCRDIENAGYLFMPKLASPLRDPDEVAPGLLRLECRR